MSEVREARRGNWIGVDFDGTLATYGKELGVRYPELGEPVPRMVRRVRAWLADGLEVRIVTARVSSSGNDGGEGNPPDTVENQRARIQAWCLRHLGRLLPVTAEKDGGMLELWDDRAVRVNRNTGTLASSLPRRGSPRR